MRLLLAAWVIAALNTAYGLGAREFGWGFWLSLVLMLGIPVLGIVWARDER